MEKEQVTLSVITVNYNGLANTCELLDTIPPCSFPMEVIVVDNGSRNDEAALIAERHPHVRTIRSTENLGFAGGNNLGIKAAKGKFFFLVNNDTVFKTPWNAEALMARLQSSEHIGAVCPKIRFAWGENPIQFAGYTKLSAITLRNRAIGFGEADHGQYDVPHPTPYAHGAAMMLKREAVERAGLMPECYFLYYEELDWSLALRRAGYDIWYEPAATVYHKESQTTGRQSPLRTYYITRNRLLFSRRNNKGFAKALSYIYIIGIVTVRDMLKHLLHRQPDLIRATVRGVAHFLKTKNATT